MLRKDYFYKGLWSQGGSCSFRSQESFSQPLLSVVTGVYECHTCGLFQRVGTLRPGQVAACSRCGGQLARRRRTSAIMAPLAFCVASIALYGALLVSPLMMLDVFGRQNTVSLLSGPVELMEQGFGEVGILVMLATVLLPGCVLALMGAILYGGSRSEMPDWVRPCLAWYGRLRPWSMIEVYVIGVIVAYTKLVDLAVVMLLPGVFLLGALMITMAAMDSTFDASLIWRHRSLDHGLRCYDGHHQPMPPVSHMLSCEACHMVLLAENEVDAESDMGDCPRCGQILRRRRRKSVQSGLAFLLAALIFYIPANIFPVMTYAKVGKGHPNTIISGVIELWNSGLYFLSLLVLFASITVPVLKILSLFCMIYCEKTKKSYNMVLLSKLYRIVVFIGRWSMIDVFMISILVAVVRFSFLAHIKADPGVVFFAMVVVLTIFAADLYDPRGMWDAVGMNDTARKPVMPSDGAGEVMEPKHA